MATFSTGTVATFSARIDITFITGDSGVGKSTFALALAVALAGAVVKGNPFLGLKTAQQRRLYVDGENPASVVRQRLKRLAIRETDALTVWGEWNSDLQTDGFQASSVGSLSIEGASSMNRSSDFAL